MADNNNRLELNIEAVDNSGPATKKAQANFKSIEDQAARAARAATGAIDAQTIEFARSIDRTSQAAIKSLERLEARAALAGKSAVEKLVIQRDSAIKRLGSDEQAIQRTVAAYDKLITARQKYESAQRSSGSGPNLNYRRLILGAKDLAAGYPRGAILEGTDFLIGTSGSGGALSGVASSLTEITGLSNAALISIGGVVGGFVALNVAGVAAMRGIAEQGREIQNIALRTGIKPENVQNFQFAAKAVGANSDILDRLTRGLAEASNDNSPTGAKGRNELARLGVNLRDQFGDLRPTEQVLLDLADAINKMPPGLQRSAASMEIFKRIGVEAVPYLADLRKNLEEAQKLGPAFSNEDLAAATAYEREIAAIDERINRIKFAVEKPLALVIDAGLVVATGASRLLQIPGSYVSGLITGAGSLRNPATDLPRPGVPGAEEGYKLASRANADLAIGIFQRSQGIDAKIEDARKALTAFAEPQIGVTSEKDFADYQAAYSKLQGLERRKKALDAASEATLAARKEALQLSSEYAGIQLSSRLREINAETGTNRLTSPADLVDLLNLTQERVGYEQAQKLNDRRYQKDDKTGAVIDVSGTREFRSAQQQEEALLPARLRNEYAKAMTEIEDRDARYFQSQRDQEGKLWEEVLDRRAKGAKELADDEERQYTQIRDRRFEIEAQTNDRARELALQQLGIVDAQSLKEKQALEGQKYQIEKSYADKSLQIQIARLQTERSIAIGEEQKKAYALGYRPGETEYDNAGAVIGKNYDQQIQAALDTAAATDQINRVRATNDEVKLQIDENRRVFDSLKHSAEGLFDALISRSQSFGDALKATLKSAILTPIKDILSSQTAAALTEAITGQHVTFGEVGNGQGQFGRVSGVLGRLGLGQPRFSGGNINAPGHLGDASLISGAVPVVVVNSGSASSPSGGFRSFTPLAGASHVGALALLASGLAFAGPSGVPPLLQRGGYGVDTTINYDTGGSDSFSSVFGGSSGTGGSTATYGSESLGIPGGYGLRLPGFGGIPGLGGGGGLSGAFGSLKDIFYNSGSIPLGPGEATTAAGIAQSLGGGIIGKTAGGLAGFGSSAGGALLGGTLAIDGFKRGGIAGAAELTAGGAELGFKFGGPFGAAIGAGAGLAAGIFNDIFGGSDVQHTKDLVKQVYGFSINDATAKQIIEIAKQSYGGQISVAIRSQQVRDLLKLYAESTGSSAQKQFVADTVHSASLVESGGKLYQGAFYDNGQAYTYASSLSTLGGISSTTIGTSARGAGGPVIVQVSTQATQDLWRSGTAQAIQGNPRLVANSAQSGYQQSSSRGSNATSVLGPNAILM